MFLEMYKISVKDKKLVLVLIKNKYLYLKWICYLKFLL